MIISGAIIADDQSVVAVDQSISTANLFAVTAESSMGTLKQSFEHKDQSVNTEETIDNLNKTDEIPPFKAKFARRYEEGYGINDLCYEAWLAFEYPNELNVESMHDYQLLSNDTAKSL